MTSLITLLLVFQVKHFLADYPLQTPYMLNKFRGDWEFLKPLAAHCGVHSIFTFYISWFWYWLTPNMPLVSVLYFPLLDFCIHFVMDRIKAGPHYLGRYKALSANDFKIITSPDWGGGKDTREKLFRDNTRFWWSLGLDQMVHHLTHYLIIYLMLTWRA